MLNEIARLTFRVHAVQRMFRWNVSEADVRTVLEHGETIENRPEEMPYPVRLILGRVEGRPTGPWHDATTMMTGPAARALAELARERGESGTGERVEPKGRIFSSPIEGWVKVIVPAVSAKASRSILPAFLKVSAIMWIVA